VLFEHARVDFLDRVLAGECDVEHVVQGHHSGVYSVVTSTRGGHCTDVLDIDDVSQHEIAASLVKLVVFNQEFEEGVGLLGSVLVDERHVQIIDKQNHLLSQSLRAVALESLLVDVFLNNVLEILAVGTRREIDVKNGVHFIAKLAEAAEHCDSLCSSRVTTEHDWALVLKQYIHQPRVAGCVLGGHKNR